MNDYMQYEGLALRVVPVKTKSDKSLSIYGSGRVALDKVYDNVMNKFTWGNFDKADVFVNESYAAAIQAHRMIISRTAEGYLKKGIRDRAVDLADKYFEAFPHKNFPYDYRAFYMISVYLQAEEFDKALPHLRILANETADQLGFYYSIGSDVLETSFSTDFQLADRTMRDIMDAAKRSGNSEFEKEVTDLFAIYQNTEELKD